MCQWLRLYRKPSLHSCRSSLRKANCGDVSVAKLIADAVVRTQARKGWLPTDTRYSYRCEWPFRKAVKAACGSRVAINGG
jgi:hypothetical protein